MCVPSLGKRGGGQMRSMVWRTGEAVLVHVLVSTLASTCTCSNGIVYTCTRTHAHAHVHTHTHTHTVNRTTLDNGVKTWNS